MLIGIDQTQATRVPDGGVIRVRNAMETFFKTSFELHRRSLNRFTQGGKRCLKREQNAGRNFRSSLILQYPNHDRGAWDDRLDLVEVQTRIVQTQRSSFGQKREIEHPRSLTRSDKHHQQE